MSTSRTAQAPVQVEIALPKLNFVNYSRVLPFRLNHTGNAVLRQVTISVDSRALQEGSSLCRDWIEKRGEWLDRLPIEPVRTGVSTIDLRISFQRGAMLREIWLCKGDWRVKDAPKSLQELKVEVRNERVDLGDKGMQGALVADGDVKVGHSSNIHIDGDVNQSIDSILDKEDENPQFYPLILELEKRELIDFRNQAGMELIAVHEGEFHRGSPSLEEGRAPFDNDEQRSQVRISRSFWMGKYEVTQRQWQQVMGDGGGYKQEEFKNSDYPAHGMNWTEAREFCEELTRHERKRGALPNGYVYRLPTETEWEYACRSGSENDRYDDLELCANTKESQKGMCEVGQFRPNEWGFHDMLGNVFEWTLDAYGEYSLGDYINPLRAGTIDAKRMIRGGCFQADASYARAAARVAVKADQNSGRIGIRVVLAEEGWPEESHICKEESAEKD